jgi:O-antigen ligase
MSSTDRLSRRIEVTVAVLLVLLAIAAAFPHGANRPVLWFHGAAAAFALCAAALLSAMMREQRFPAGPQGGRPDLFMPLLVGAILVLTPIFFTVAAHIGMPGFSAIDPGAGFAGALRQVSTAAFALAALHVFRRRVRALAALTALLVGISIHAAWGVWGLRSDAITLPGELAYPGFLTGGFVNRNSMASHLMIGIMIATALLFRPPVERECRGISIEIVTWRAFLVVMIAFLAWSIAMTGSRMGMLSLSVGVFVMAIGLFVSGRRRQGYLLATVSSGLPLVAFAANGATLERFLDLDTGISGRIMIWRDTLAVLRESPLTGYGLDGFEIAHRRFGAGLADGDLRWNDAHSSLLENLVDLGPIAGLLPPILILVIMIALFRRIAKGAPAASASLAAAGALAAGATHSLVDFTLEIQGVLLPLALLCALGLAPIDKSRKETSR